MIDSEQQTTLLKLYASLWQLHLAEYHWHAAVSGTSFYGVHQLFEDLYEDTENHIHILAEWMQRLGTVPPSHLEHLDEYGEIDAPPLARPEDPVPAETALAEALNAKRSVFRLAKDGVDLFEDDPSTEDVLIEIMREQEEHVYLLRQATA